MPKSHSTWLTGLGLRPSSLHVTWGLAYRLTQCLPPFLRTFPAPSPDFQEPQFLLDCLGRPGPPPPCRQRERPQAWPLCNDQITGQAGRSDKRSIYFGAFSNPGCPHPADENGETGGSMTPGPVSRSRRRAQTELKTIPWHQGKRQGLPGPGLEEAPLGAWVTRPRARDPGATSPPLSPSSSAPTQEHRATSGLSAWSPQHLERPQRIMVKESNSRVRWPGSSPSSTPQNNGHLEQKPNFSEPQFPH